MNRPDCPDDDQLKDYAQGVLPAAQVEGLERHMEDCSTCSHRVDLWGMQVDPMTRLLQMSAEATDSQYLDEAEYSGLFQKYARLPIAVPESSERLNSTAGKSEAVASPVSRITNPRQTLGPYLLGKVIGRGGMGTVFKAQHQSLRTTVAIKLIQSHRIQGKKTLDRFRREMQAAGKIVHPNVVQARDAGEFDGVHFLAMEFVDGLDLAALLKRHERLSVGHACEMICMAAMGLQAIHQAGMVHRDLKPGNLMLARDGKVKILDLGLALLHPQHSTSIEELTSTGQLMGTVDYMAPEQADDTHSVDFRADIYGLGATLFALLTGRGPLGDRDQSLIRKLSFLANKPAPSVQSLRDDVPDRLAEIIARLMNRVPSARFSSAEDVASALAPFASDAGLTDLLPGEFAGALSEEFIISEGPLEDTIVLDSVTGNEQRTYESGKYNSLSTGTEITVVADAASVSSDAGSIHHEATLIGAPVLTGDSFRSLWRVTLPIGLILIAATAFAMFRGKSDAVDSTDGVLNAVAISSTTESKAEPEIAAATSPAAASLNAAATAVSMETLHAIAATPVEQLLSPGTELHWKVFSSYVEPDVRTDAIHYAHGVISPEFLLRRLLVEESPSIRAGLLLGTGTAWTTSPYLAPEPLSLPEPESGNSCGKDLRGHVN